MNKQTSLRWSLCCVLLAAALTGANCRSNDKATLADASAKSTPPTNEAPPNEGLTEAEAARLLPGIETTSLTPKQRDDLVKVTQEIICPCAAETVASCIRKPQLQCKPALRLTELAKKLIAAGAPQGQAIMYVEQYYGSFDDSRRVNLEQTGPTKGAESAKVVVQEFSDFQCPMCRAAHPVLGELVKKYPNDVKVVFRNFPLPQHDQAQTAALYGAYAFSKGKFWPVADYFFQHQDSLGPATFQAAAKEAGLNFDEMKKAVETDPKFAAIVDRDVKAGTDARISGTPSIFINGRKTVLPTNLEYLSWSVEDELEWLANGKKWTSK